MELEIIENKKKPIIRLIKLFSSKRSDPKNAGINKKVFLTQ